VIKQNTNEGRKIRKQTEREKEKYVCKYSWREHTGETGK
jgi:hypothetical protein